MYEKQVVILPVEKLKAKGADISLKTAKDLDSNETIIHFQIYVVYTLTKLTIIRLKKPS